MITYTSTVHTPGQTVMFAVSNTVQPHACTRLKWWHIYSWMG